MSTWRTMQHVPLQKNLVWWDNAYNIKILNYIKMKLVIILSALLLITSCSNKLQSEFKGDIESISEKTYSCTEKFGEPIKDKLCEGSSYHFTNNNIIKYELYNDEGDKKYSSEITYQNDKPIFKEIGNLEYDTITNDFIFIKTNQKLLDRNSISEKWLNDKGDTIFCDLDKDGYVRTQKWKDDKGIIYIHETIRDKDKNVFKFKLSINNKPYSIVKTEFDKNYFKIKEETENIEYKWIKFLTYKYKTDNIGNWIERITYDDNTPTAITFREIIYNK